MFKAAWVVVASTSLSSIVDSGSVDEPSRTSPPGVEIGGASAIGDGTWSPCRGTAGGAGKAGGTVSRGPC